MKYLIKKEKEKVVFSSHEKSVLLLRDKNKILALPNENDDGIDTAAFFKKTALDNNIEIINLKMHMN